jgi:hypothetical protein
MDWGTVDACVHAHSREAGCSCKQMLHAAMCACWLQERGREGKERRQAAASTQKGLQISLLRLSHLSSLLPSSQSRP